MPKGYTVDTFNLFIFLSDKPDKIHNKFFNCFGFNSNSNNIANKICRTG